MHSFRCRRRWAYASTSRSDPICRPSRAKCRKICIAGRRIQQTCICCGQRTCHSFVNVNHPRRVFVTNSSCEGDHACKVLRHLEKEMRLLACEMVSTRQDLTCRRPRGNARNIIGTKVDWDADDIRIMLSVAILLHLHLTVKTQNEWTLGRLLYCWTCKKTAEMLDVEPQTMSCDCNRSFRTKALNRHGL